MLLLEGSMLREEGAGISGLGPGLPRVQHKGEPLPGGGRGFTADSLLGSSAHLFFFFLRARDIDPVSGGKGGGKVTGWRNRWDGRWGCGHVWKTASAILTRMRHL